MSWNMLPQGGYVVYPSQQMQQPPTPGATPTSATAPGFDFSALSPEYQMFDDAQRWQEIYRQQSQQQMAYPAVQRLSTGNDRKRQSLTQDQVDAQLLAHYQLPADPSLPLPQVHPSRQLSSSPLKRNRSSRAVQSATPVRPNIAEMSLESARTVQTATPPPTSTSRSVRRVSVQKRNSATSVSSLAGGIQSGAAPSETPIRSIGSHSELMGDSPEQLQHPFSSGDIFAYPMSAPATHQQRYLWDASPTVVTDGRGPTSNPIQDSRAYYTDMSMQGQHEAAKFISSPPPMFLFGTETRPLAYNASLASNHEQSDPFVFSDAAYPMSDVQQQSGPGSAESSNRNGVNPHLIFNLPTPVSPPSADDASVALAVGMRRRPASMHFGETLRQRDLDTLRNVKPRAPLSRTNSRSSVQSMNTLKRNSLMGKATAAAAAAAGGPSAKPRPLSRIGSIQGERPLMRSSSLTSLKRHSTGPTLMRTPSLAGSISRMRTVVSLTIDAHGRARTERQEVPASGSSGSERGDEDTISRGSLYDEDESEPWDYLDSDSSDDEDVFHEKRFTPSRRSSLAIPKHTSHLSMRPPSANISRAVSTSVVNITPHKETCISPSLLSSSSKLAPAFNLTSSPPLPEQDHALLGVSHNIRSRSASANVTSSFSNIGSVLASSKSMTSSMTITAMSSQENISSSPIRSPSQELPTPLPVRRKEDILRVSDEADAGSALKRIMEKRMTVPRR